MILRSGPVLINIFSLPSLRFFERHLALSYRQSSSSHNAACQHFEGFQSDKKVFSTDENGLVDDKSPYYFENLLRKVYPYYFSYSTYCKGRWFNRNIVDVYCAEFVSVRKEQIEQRILKGSLRVNGNIVDINYKLRQGDFITSTIHKHELAVLSAPIKVLHEDDDLLVVDKPPSIPVHPCGMYQYNTVVFILGEYRKWRHLKVINRLDRLVSGILIFAKNSTKSQEIHKELNLRKIRKEYICRVEGEFPNGIVFCDKPIKKVYSQVGISLVNPEGKVCTTEFQKLSFNGKSSVVLCKPHTGRTHQIRIHLQYLGHPIVNDPLYNSYAFGPEKGKMGIFHKSIDQLLKDLLDEHSPNWWLEESVHKKETSGNNITSFINLNLYRTHEDLLRERYKKDESRFTYDKDCLFCRTAYRNPNLMNLFMCLHAYRYQGEKWDYISEMPAWAASNWDVM